MKKSISVLMAIVMALSSMLCVSISAYAGDIDFSNSALISVNTSVSGAVTRGYDYERNVYRIVTTKNGMLDINMSTPLQGDTNDYWCIALYNSDYTQITEAKIYGNKTSTSAVKTGISAGTYYIVVNSTSWRDAMSTDRYTMTPRFTESKYWEKELNEDYLSANLISVNKIYYGTTDSGYDYEKDYYKFNTEKDGVVTINFSNPLQVSTDDFWQIKLYNEEYREIANRYIHGNNGTTVFPSIGLAKGTYYIVVNSTSWRDAMSTDVYKLLVKYEASDTWEKELNEDFVSSSKIGLNKTYYGSVHSGYDYEKDFYKFNITNSGTYNIRMFTPNLKFDDAGWRMYLYNSEYNEIGNVEIKGNITSNGFLKYLAKGTYYIVVNSASWRDAVSDATYKLSVSNYVPKPAVNLTLSLKKVKVKRKAKKLVLTATVKKNGKAAANKKVIFRFNGKKYKAYTNYNGVAKVKIKKSVLKKLKKGKKVTYSAKCGKKIVKRVAKVK